ncbi:EamA family transporter RarD [Alpinimonas psychrophila]|uniref:Chloramphenicol-sensitive protein RarD n=1 Tax=Alpinimonas psychrophila TaxID=748908 RepID=A0A7W3JVE6_9MICO|nr:chloramphenicol-sensitive protein RarD [Alpinimonas psychrophila]
MSPANSHQKLSRPGLLYAFGAYGMWGLFPLYFLALLPASPFEIVSYRIIFSLIFCALLLTITRGWRRYVVLLRQRRILLTMALAGVLIYANWQIFIIAVVSNQVLESSLGYFINPIFTVVLGVTILKEKLRPLQWVAVGISFIAVLVLTFSYGKVPWISLALATSFGLYGLIKKQVGPRVDAISGLTMESMWVLPIAILQLVIVGNLVGLTFVGFGVGHTLLLMSSGILTALPLLLFAASAKRLPLTAIGLIQYSTPVVTFLLALFVLHEAMPSSRWVGFILIWVSLLVLTVDMLTSARTARLARAAYGATLS